MTQSPKKYVSVYTSSTTNRGVEAKEVEVANIPLDTSSAQETTERSQATADTGSYLQVVVQKHKKKEPTSVATQTSPPARHPVASSPLRPLGAGDHPLYMLPPHMQLYNTQHADRERRNEKKREKPTVQRSFWSKFADDKESPDKIDFYYFEKTSSDYLATSDGTYTYTEKCALNMSRIPRRIVAEVFSVPQIIASVPVAVVLSVERSILVTLRNFIVGSVQICSDYFFKPILALSFNAIINPPLVFIGNVGRGVREALKPIAGVMGDFLEPLVNVLSAVRLVSVENRCSHNV